jgi:DNA-binding LytR/AlgR family response regulator
MKICITEDDRTQTEYLTKIISQWSNEVSVTSFKDAEEMLFICDNNYPYDLVFLDIEMSEINGIELAKRIREVNKTIMIVFVTGREEYVFEGYEVNAYRYVLKPIEKEIVFSILEYVDKNKSVESKYIIIKTNEESIRLEHKEILFVEAKGHYLMIKTTDNTYKTLMTLKVFLSKVDNKLFISTHRSYIVNLASVNSINRDSCILDKCTVPISRNEYRRVNEAFVSFFKGEL